MYPPLTCHFPLAFTTPSILTAIVPSGLLSITWACDAEGPTPDDNARNHNDRDDDELHGAYWSLTLMTRATTGLGR